MKRLKSLAIAGAISGITAFGSLGAQGHNVLSAWEMLEQYKREIEKNEEVAIRSLIRGRDYINEAVANPSTSGTSKAWKRRGDIYYFIFKDKSPRLMLERKNAEDTAAASYLKALTVEIDRRGKPKIEEERDLMARLTELSNLKIEAGSKALEDEKYQIVIDEFERASTWLKALADITERNQKLLETVATLRFQQGIAAFRLEKMDLGMSYFEAAEKMGMKDKDFYQVLLVSLLQHMERKEDKSPNPHFETAMKRARAAHPNEQVVVLADLQYNVHINNETRIIELLQEAKEKFPESKSDFMKEEVNFYLERGQDEKALKILRETIASVGEDDESLPILCYIAGNLLFNAAEKKEANTAAHNELLAESKSMFQRTVELNPKYAEGYVALANFHVVKGNQMILEANNLPLSKAKEYETLKKGYTEEFKAAAELLEKAYAIEQNERVRKILMEVQGKAGNLARVTELRSEQPVE